MRAGNQRSLGIAVASGKGGTGKTTVATNLAWVAGRRGHAVGYKDCDVEEPNGHIFLAPRIATRRPIGVDVPVIDPTRCNACGECSALCQFSALVQIAGKVLSYPELCHSCGGCRRVCPQEAITYTSRRIGVMEDGASDGIRFAHGILDVGQALAPPLIHAVIDAKSDATLTILDAPPGTSCPVIESVRASDFVLLVTEPTPFGLNDLHLAVDMVRSLGLPTGVLVNRADLGDGRVREFCRAEGLDLLAEIPDDRRIAEAYSRGELISRVIGEYEPLFADLLNAIVRRSTAPAALGGRR